MSEKLGDSVILNVEIEDRPKSLLLVLDRKSEYNIFPWQDAFRLALLMERVVKDVAGEFRVFVDRHSVLAQRAQINFVPHGGLVAMLIGWSDRIRFSSLEAFSLVARDLRKAAQDSHLEQRGIKFQYDKDGMIKKLHNIKAGTVQLVR